MIAENRLYRVITVCGSKDVIVRYCGGDRQAARVAYHQGKPSDPNVVGMSGPSDTLMEIIHDAGTDDFADDAVVRKESS